MSRPAIDSQLVRRVVTVSAFGYFVDILDLFLFSVLRVPSLAALGVAPERFLQVGESLLRWQMAGLLLGSFVWGVLADRYGRVRALYGSILIYSLATLVNAQVDTLSAYTVCRFLAGLGLGGELGAAITLVSETLPTEKRGLGTTVVAGFGLCGGVFAAGLAELLPWRSCYAIGGALGLLLLLLRVRLLESPLFRAAAQRASSAVLRGSPRLLMATPRRRGIYVRLVLVGVPIWFVAGILMVFSPEFGKALGVPGVTAARAVLSSYLGVSIGDFLSGLLSQRLRSRRQAIVVFLGLVSLGIVAYLRAFGVSTSVFYAICFVLGLGTGYWAVLVTYAAEHFGTNLRATVATTVPNLVRASVIPLSFAFHALQARHGIVTAAVLLAIACVATAVWALFGLEETFSRGLDFEEDGM